MTPCASSPSEPLPSMSGALLHIEEKLKRADEVIAQLESEVDQFLNDPSGPGRELFDYTPESAAVFRQRHADRTVPPRLSVLAGEVFHEQRSSLNYLVDALIRRDGGTPTRQTQFPIVEDEPVGKRFRTYLNQIAGITNHKVCGKLWQLQPWRARGDRTVDHWLWKLSELNNQDKHSSLILHVTVVDARVRYKSTWADSDIEGEVDSIDDGSAIAEGTLEIFGQKMQRTNVRRRLVTSVALPWVGIPRHGSYDLGGALRAITSGVRSLIGEFAPFLHEDAARPRPSL
jgi:hypothetical protein